MTIPASLRERLIAAAREFNNGHYFEAHEVLEDGLEDVPDELWELFVGLIQVAVGYHKVTLNLWDGAGQMLSRALDKIEPFPLDEGGLNVDGLRQRVRADIDRLRSGSFDLDAFVQHPPRLQFARP